MMGLTWLHLSDWHQKGTEFDREVVLEGLLNDIKKRVEISPCLAEVNFIVFSGDLAFSGKPEEYKTAKEKLLDPILEATGLKPNRLFIVPGNHDLDKDELKLFSSDLQKPIESESQTQEWLTNERKRRKLQDLFWAFTKFVNGYTGQKSPDYADSCVWPINGKKISISGLNSALGCGRRENERGTLVVGEPQIRESKKGLAEEDIKIAVLHHPLDWLAEHDFIRIERPLRSSFDFILCGHTHRPRVDASHSTQGNAVIIPAGASYRKRVEESPHYTSSYNFVHLDFEKGNGSVFLRRWNDEMGEWAEDIGSARAGKFNFELNKVKINNKLDSIVSPAVPSGHQYKAVAPSISSKNSNTNAIVSNSCKLGNHVFISYSWEDEQFVINLANSLKARGVPVWLDRWDIPAGVDWDRAIDDALSSCAHFLIILSPASVGSDNVRSELHMAFKNGKHIVPVLYQACIIPRRLLMKKYADFSNCGPDSSSVIEQLILALDINSKNLKKQVHPNVNWKDNINIIELRCSSPEDSLPSKKKMKYKKGDIVEVIKVPDPKVKRGASYFVADDGNGGLVVLGTPPSIDIGQKARVEISGVMEKEGLYNFAIIDGKSKLNPRSRDKGSPR